MDVRNVKNKFSIEKAREAQLRLSEKVIFEDLLPNNIQLVAGVDATYRDSLSISAATVLDYSSLKVLETKTAICKTRFPYISTLLSFREAPPLIKSIRKLRLRPDVFLVDAHGYAHPYHCGLACHLGVVMERPTIGVAKSRLIGDVEDAPDKVRDVSMLKHRGEVVGALVKTKQDSRPVYVSVGHMISLNTSINIVKQCSPHTRIPEPILKAHQAANKVKEKIRKKTH